MTSNRRGFSLIELTMALLMTLGVGLIVFQLFLQNEHIFRDQHLVIEMQQSARAVASQIADEIRMAGTGLPMYASIFDNSGSEAASAILPTSTASRIDFRAGLNNIEARVTSAAPIDLAIGSPITLSVGSASLFPVGQSVYLWGPANSPVWTWVRAGVSGMGWASLTVVPKQSGTGGAVRFSQSPHISLEEAVSIYLSGSSIRRATATDLTDAAAPAWSAANEIGRSFVSLSFAYFDKNGVAVTPATLAERLAIAGVDVSVTAQTAEPLSTGERPSYSLSFRILPPNLRLRL